jgi:hypothetical protein
MKVQYAREIIDNWIEVKASRIREAGKSFSGPQGWSFV